MSYCRFSEADIYVFPSDRGFECCGCPRTGTTFVTKDAPVMIQHMNTHKNAGLDVPEDAFWGVWDNRHMYRSQKKVTGAIFTHKDNDGDTIEVAAGRLGAIISSASPSLHPAAETTVAVRYEYLPGLIQALQNILDEAQA